MQAINTLCQQLNLGSVTQEPELQLGGSLHELWYVQTTQGRYAIKRVNQKNIELLGQRLLPFETAQQFAHTQWQQCVMDGELWLVHAWVEGQCLAPQQCGVEHASALGELLKRLHKKTYDLDAPQPTWHAIDLQYWIQMIQAAKHKNIEWAKHYENALPILAQWVENIAAVGEYFSSDTVMSHRDISPSNVVWSPSGVPQLIDWEFAGWIHPELEAYIVMKNFDVLTEEKQQAFIAAYGQPLTFTNAQLHAGYLGYCLDWLEFNMERSLEYPEQRHHSDPQLVDYLAALIAGEF